MEKTKRKKYKQEIGDIFIDLLQSLNISGWSLYVLLPEDEGWEESAVGGFSVYVEYPYKQIKLVIPEAEIKMPISKNQKEALLHEAIHVLLWDYTYLAEYRFINKKQLLDAEDRLVDSIKEILLRYILTNK